MAKTKATEREFAGHVIHWIKEQLKEGGLPFENATNDSGKYRLTSGKGWNRLWLEIIVF